MRYRVRVLQLLLATWVGTVVYTHLLYPLLIFSVGLSRQEPVTQQSNRPTVSLIIAAYNEEEIIAEKINNSLDLTYPVDKLEIIVFSDASSDATDAIVREFEDEGVTLVRVEGRVGKTACQNRVAAMASGEVLVFSDANSLYEPDTIQALVDRFNENVGCVVGALHYEQDGQNTGGIPVYRALERFIQRWESRVGSVVKSNGAIYAVRADSYVDLPPDLMSDFGEPLAIRANGEDVKFAPDAIARERTREDLESELQAKIRITTRSWHTIWAYRNLLNPWESGVYAIQLWSRTVLLWLTPLFLLASAASIIVLYALRPTRLHGTLLAGLLLTALSHGVAAASQERKRSAPVPAQVVHFFVISNYSLLVGLINWTRGDNVVTWETDKRAEQSAARIETDAEPH
ncbi:glycosyltransferase family 2 protein [Natrialbaceae archaeon GCM10025810]|uniref:glycosyltransferase family 2 protein n=1 Tax=Halovalidus salilacus TaxID=3075124 RepID=UPI003606574C